MSAGNPLLIAGNWKMNGLIAAAEELRRLIGALEVGAASPRSLETLICPPATLIRDFARLAAGSSVLIGGQDCHMKLSGAHTGDISAAMLKDAGASHVILGHSERRAGHKETDALIAEKALAAKAAGLKVILCLGETLAERDAGRALEIVRAQFQSSVPGEFTAADMVIAYEPVWAIGTGRTPSLEEIAALHDELRALAVRRFGDAGKRLQLLYGGSVKPENASAILALENVGGALVGGASLKAEDFLRIIAAAA